MPSPPPTRSKDSPEPSKSMEADTSSHLPGQSSDTFSLLDQLPAELIFIVFDFTPMSIFTLRLVSQTVKSRVDEYALQRSNVVKVVKIVDQVHGFNELYSQRTLHKLNIQIDEALLGDKDQAEVRFRIEAYEGMEQIFELRMKLMQSPFDLKLLIKIRRSCAIRRSFYFFKCNNFMDASSLKFLGKCMGHRIGSAYFGLGHPISQLPLLDSLLEGIHFKKLIIYPAFTLSSDLVDHILQTIKLRGVDHLTLAVHKFDPSIDAIKLLRELSTLIDRLHILQYKLDDIAEDQPYLLGLYNENWGRLILEMLSNKLSRLSLFNSQYGEYLPKGSADFLREQLPLLKRKIWMWITCKKHYGDCLDYIKDDYSIRAFCHQSATCGILTIAHASRRAERPS